MKTKVWLQNSKFLISPAVTIFRLLCLGMTDWFVNYHVTKKLRTHVKRFVLLCFDIFEFVKEHWSQMIKLSNKTHLMEAYAKNTHPSPIEKIVTAMKEW